MSKLRLATVWLDGCSGCHMSFLDLDERLLALAERFELVYSPLVDAKVFPEGVDVSLVEGAVASDDDLEKVRTIRERSKCLVSLGDCAVTGNVSAMRNPIRLEAVTEAAYGEALPTVDLPTLLGKVLPVHQVVAVDVYVPGCPPSADAIQFVLEELLAGRRPALAARTRFGA